MTSMCPVCHYADDVISTRIGSEIVSVCSNERHGRHEWRAPVPVKAVPTVSAPAATGPNLAELGVVDDLLTCIEPADTWIEWGVLEDRYRRLRPDVYADLLAAYKHWAQRPADGVDEKPKQTRTVSQRLSGALAKSDLVVRRERKATGAWSHLGAVPFYATKPVPPSDQTLTWETYAAEADDLDPAAWVLPETSA